MKLRIVDPNRGIMILDLSDLAKTKKEEKEEIQPPLLWMPRPRRHDPEGRNER